MNKGGNSKLILILGLLTLTSALFLPVTPWPPDGWFHTQDLLLGVFPGADNYTPIAAPALFYKINHLLAGAFQRCGNCVLGVHSIHRRATSDVVG